MFNHTLSFNMKWFIFFLFSLSSSTAFGQFIISGKVLDLYPLVVEEDSTAGLAGVKIVSIDSVYISKTDSIGNFEIIVNDFPITLSFSYPFFHTKELTITEPTDSLVISLDPVMICYLDLHLSNAQRYGFSINGGILSPALGAEVRLATPDLLEKQWLALHIDGQFSLQSDFKNYRYSNSSIDVNNLIQNWDIKLVLDLGFEQTRLKNSLISSLTVNRIKGNISSEYLYFLSPLTIGFGSLKYTNGVNSSGPILGFSSYLYPTGLYFEHSTGFYGKYFEVNSRLSKTLFWYTPRMTPFTLFLDFNSIDKFQQISAGIAFDFYYLTKSDRECLNN